jgi:aminopeptidase
MTASPSERRKTPCRPPQNVQVMKAMIRIAVLSAMMSAVGCAGTAPRGPATDEPTAHTGANVAAAFDHRAIATMIASRGAVVQVGDLVRIGGSVQDVPFMERIAVAVAAAGGHPLVTVFSSETLQSWYEQVPAQYDTMRDEWLWRFAQSADVEIRVGALEPAGYVGIDPARLDAWDHANAGIGALRRERDVRVVYVGNGPLNPSDWRARMLGVERSELDRVFYQGLMADPARLVAAGAPLREILLGASSVRVRHPNGTDITVGIAAGTRVVLSDGTTMPPPRASGTEGELNITWLPAGEVTLGLDPECADGRLDLERVFLDGQVLGPLTLAYSKGRLVSTESDTDISGLQEYLQSALPLSERLTGLKFGLNPPVTDTHVLPFMGAGMVSLSTGRNVELGGDIALPFLIFLTLAGTTVEVDGRVVVEDGVLRNDFPIPTTISKEPT